MKKMLSCLALLATGTLSFSAIADNFIYYHTPQEAALHCPANTGLTFTQNNPNVQNGEVLITGTNNVNFTSYSSTSKSSLFCILINWVQQA